MKEKKTKHALLDMFHSTRIYFVITLRCNLGNISNLDSVTKSAVFVFVPKFSERSSISCRFFPQPEQLRVVVASVLKHTAVVAKKFLYVYYFFRTVRN